MIPATAGRRPRPRTDDPDLLDEGAELDGCTSITVTDDPALPVDGAEKIGRCTFITVAVDPDLPDNEAEEPDECTFITLNP